MFSTGTTVVAVSVQRETLIVATAQATTSDRATSRTTKSRTAWTFCDALSFVTTFQAFAEISTLSTMIVVNIKIVAGATTVREALRTNTLALLTGFSVAA